MNVDASGAQAAPAMVSSQRRWPRYSPMPDVWDELKGGNGRMRTHWRSFIGKFQAMPPSELARRWDVAQTLLRDNGVTYNLHGDPAGLDRPWRLDPLPLVIGGHEWAELSKGIAQRARLLDAILTDLHGPRALIAKGIIPPALVHANPGFLRPCHGWTPVNNRHLTVYAADLGRGSDGKWRVFADRTESPTGMGYTLENRVVVGRALSDIMREVQVERVAPFFDALRASLRAASPRLTDEPRVVVLTPGPYNETYFEHAFLARQMGITLVQGEDLTARDNHIFLKTLTGLQRVDVIFRLLNGEWCDPLDLRGDSMLGVAGLVQAARAGNVAVVNALGSGLVDGGAINPFLPAAAQALLHDGLILNSAPTWWCGTPADRDHVIANLDSMTLRPAFKGRTRIVLDGGAMTEPERATVAQSITARPWEWVAQSNADLSTAPVWTEDGLEPQFAMVRVFAVAGPNGLWTVMPGGLVRAATQRHALAGGRLQSSGGGSKDLWVLSHEADNATPTGESREQTAPVKLVRGSRDLPSRVADNMYWLGRYLERTDAAIRLLRSALLGLDDALDQGEGGQAKRHLKALIDFGMAVPRTILTMPPSRWPGALIDFHMKVDGEGLAGEVEHLSRVAANLRDRLSVDTWRVLRHLHDRMELARAHADGPRGDIVGWLNELILIVEAAHGLSMENMTRGPLWQFMDSGRRIERAIFMSDFIAGAMTDRADESEVPMDLMLEIADSVMTYRSRYLATPRLAGVLDLLLCDESNPRSLGFQLSALSAHMDGLAEQNSDGFFKPEQRLMTVLCGIVRTIDIDVLATCTHDGGFHDAECVMESISSRLWELSEVISREYFTHARWRLPSRALDIPS